MIIQWLFAQGSWWVSWKSTWFEGWCCGLSPEQCTHLSFMWTGQGQWIPEVWDSSLWNECNTVSTEHRIPWATNEQDILETEEVIISPACQRLSGLTSSLGWEGTGKQAPPLSQVSTVLTDIRYHLLELSHRMQSNLRVFFHWNFYTTLSHFWPQIWLTPYFNSCFIIKPRGCRKRKPWIRPNSA